MIRRSLMAIVVLGISLVADEAKAGFIFRADFDNANFFAPGISGGFSGITTIESVQGYSGIGTAGNIFGGNFLRNNTGGSPVGASGLRTTLFLTNLPDHTTVTIGFLLAIIDSWDIEPLPDNFNVFIDGVPLFDEHFTNNPDENLQGYNPPPLVQLLDRPFPQLGFNEGFEGRIGFVDSAWDMNFDPIFQDISHVGETLKVEFFADGPGWSGGGDESFGLENVSVSFNGTIVPEPSSYALFSVGMLIVGFVGWRKRKLTIVGDVNLSA